MWKLMAKVQTLEGTQQRNLVLTTLSLLVNDHPCITCLWRLAALGTTEPSENETTEELANAENVLFLQT